MFIWHLRVGLHENVLRLPQNSLDFLNLVFLPQKKHSENRKCYEMKLEG